MQGFWDDNKRAYGNSKCVSVFRLKLVNRLVPSRWVRCDIYAIVSFLCQLPFRMRMDCRKLRLHIRPRCLRRRRLIARSPRFRKHYNSRKLTSETIPAQIDLVRRASLTSQSDYEGRQCAPATERCVIVVAPSSPSGPVPRWQLPRCKTLPAQYFRPGPPTRGLPRKCERALVRPHAVKYSRACMMRRYYIMPKRRRRQTRRG